MNQELEELIERLRANYTTLTSIDLYDSQVVGIGTTFLDNVYYVH